MADVDITQTNPLSAAGDSPEDYELGLYAPFDFSAEPFAELSKDAKDALLELDKITDKADIAARRLEVEQSWKSLHFDRGYQHLFHDKKGGWLLPGQSTTGGKKSPTYDAVHTTNYYASEGDKICAALTIELPQIEFFPKHPEYAPDVKAAEQADKFKDIWCLNNDFQSLMGECARIFWNEDRFMMYTRYVVNGQKYGFEEKETDEDLFSPEEPTTAPQASEVEAGSDFAVTEEGETPEVEAEEKKKPRGQEVTTIHGKLDHKVPISVDHIEQMPWAKLFQDLDVALARATFPWIADKIQPGADGVSDTELDRIARENVRQAVLGAYVTGDSQQRHTVVKHTWFRPSMFFDVNVKDEVRQELLDKFPDGCLMVKAGSEFAFARNENLDDHIVIAHALTGKGQNRRALGSSMVALQERINDMFDLLDSFARRTVPKKWFNQEAFDLSAMKNQNNSPGATGGFQPQPGLTTADQYMMIEPTPQPQPFLAEFTKWISGEVTQDITGAVPSLFGGATNTDTVGGIKIQRDQALQRIGPAWNEIQRAFSAAAKQAVCCAAACRNGETISHYVPGKGKVTVDCSDLKGSVTCYPESSPAFPESWAQREDKIMMLLDGAKGNPDFQKVMMTPRNLPGIVDALRMKGRIFVPGADDVKKQQAEFERLLRSGPNVNPQFAQIAEGLKQAQSEVQSGKQMSPEEQQAIQQGTQLLQTLPQYMSTVPVAQDDSENHVIEAAICTDWMNSSDGQSMKYGDEKQKAAFQNIALHRKEHLAMVKQLAEQNAAPPTTKPASVSLTAAYKDLPQAVQVQALAEMGMKVDAATLQSKEVNDLNKDIAKKSVPAKEQISVNKEPKMLRRR